MCARACVCAVCFVLCPCVCGIVISGGHSCGLARRGCHQWLRYARRCVRCGSDASAPSRVSLRHVPPYVYISRPHGLSSSGTRTRTLTKCVRVVICRRAAAIDSLLCFRVPPPPSAGIDECLSRSLTAAAEVYVSLRYVCSLGCLASRTRAHSVYGRAPRELPFQALQILRERTIE